MEKGKGCVCGAIAVGSTRQETTYGPAAIISGVLGRRSGPLDSRRASENTPSDHSATTSALQNAPQYGLARTSHETAETRSELAAAYRRPARAPRSLAQTLRVFAKAFSILVVDEQLEITRRRRCARARAARSYREIVSPDRRDRGNSTGPCAASAVNRSAVAQIGTTTTTRSSRFVGGSVHVPAAQVIHAGESRRLTPAAIRRVWHRGGTDVGPPLTRLGGRGCPGHPGVRSSPRIRPWALLSAPSVGDGGGHVTGGEGEGARRRRAAEPRPRCRVGLGQLCVSSGRLGSKGTLNLPVHCGDSLALS